MENLISNAIKYTGENGHICIEVKDTAIVKSIVTAHGGTVQAESSEEQGSRFTVTLPK